MLVSSLNNYAEIKVISLKVGAQWATTKFYYDTLLFFYMHLWPHLSGNDSNAINEIFKKFDKSTFNIMFIITMQ